MKRICVFVIVLLSLALGLTGCIGTKEVKQYYVPTEIECQQMVDGSIVGGWCYVTYNPFKREMRRVTDRTYREYCVWNSEGKIHCGSDTRNDIKERSDAEYNFWYLEGFDLSYCDEFYVVDYSSDKIEYTRNKKDIALKINKNFQVLSRDVIDPNELDHFTVKYEYDSNRRLTGIDTERVYEDERDTTKTTRTYDIKEEDDQNRPLVVEETIYSNGDRFLYTEKRLEYETDENGRLIGFTEDRKSYRSDGYTSAVSSSVAFKNYIPCSKEEWEAFKMMRCILDSDSFYHFEYTDKYL